MVKLPLLVHSLWDYLKTWCFTQVGVVLQVVAVSSVTVSAYFIHYDNLRALLLDCRTTS